MFPQGFPYVEAVQVHEVEIQDELHKDSSEDFDMADTGAEEVGTNQADHFSMRNLGDYSTPDYMCWRRADFVLD